MKLFFIVTRFNIYTAKPHKDLNHVQSVYIVLCCTCTVSAAGEKQNVLQSTGSIDCLMRLLFEFYLSGPSTLCNTYI